MNSPKLYFILALTLGSIALLLVGFLGGQAFERIRIRHSMGWTENYHRIFRAHGLFGKILTLDNDKLTMQDTSGTEQSIVITASTAIRRNASPAQKSDLKADQQIAVFGHPTGQGQIQAQLIRIFDTHAKP